VDTVQALREQYGADAEIYFLIGLDTVSELPSWREVRRPLKVEPRAKQLYVSTA
jgi:nicotinic acid mononucleotide adenylyltransferase